MKKRKIGSLLILIGIGIPLVLFFFQDEGEFRFKNPAVREVERNLSPQEIKAIEMRKLFKSERQRELDELLLGKDYWKSQKWTVQTEIYLFPYKYSIGIGIVLILIGVGMVIFSFFPEKVKQSKNREA